jgi:hypothetical protein
MAKKTLRVMPFNPRSHFLRRKPARDRNARGNGDEMSKFTAVVTDIREESRAGGRQRWQMALDRTEFCAGAIGELQAVARSGARLVVPVLDTVTDAAGEMWHIIEKPLAAGTTVTGHVSSRHE